MNNKLGEREKKKQMNMQMMFRKLQPNTYWRDYQRKLRMSKKLLSNNQASLSFVSISH